MTQFEQRERMAHCISLWQTLKSCCSHLITQGGRPYNTFLSLASKLPPVYLTQLEIANGAALLQAGIPVACGTLPDIGCRLGTVDGRPALLTDLTPEGLGADELLLVSVSQYLDHGLPRLTAAARSVAPAEAVLEGGCLALTGDDYADTMRGWALVRVRRVYSPKQRRCVTRCSTQTVVTRCTLAARYQTRDALLRAAGSYGGLTP